MQLKRTKGNCIVKNVIAKTEKSELTSKLKNSLFSVLIDESTDIASNKTMCIVIRHFDSEEGKITSHLWNLVQVFDKDCQAATAEHLFNLTIRSFTDEGIPIKNIIGFASDGCNVMMGANNSVSSRFLYACPGITIYKCICHSLHLCASEACKELPQMCEDLARNVYNFFKASCKRQHEFEKFQSFLDIKIHKILHPAQTRWLSLLAVIVRMLEQWAALELYFQDKVLVEKLHTVSHILQALHNPLIKLCYLFLKFMLPNFVKLNEYFQSDKTAIHHLYKKMRDSYQDLLKCFMDESYVMKTELSDINSTNQEKWKRLDEIYLGVDVMKYLRLPHVQNNDDLKKDFYTRCRNFLVVGCLQIRKRFNFDDKVLSYLSCFYPPNAVSQKTRQTTPSLLSMMESLPRVVTEDSYQQIDNEWRRFSSAELPESIAITDEIDEFWSKVLKCEEPNFQFTNLAQLALNCLSLPHSSAECERVFSRVNLIKTKCRNKLVSSTVAGLLLSKQHIRRKSGSCVSFEPTKDSLTRMTKAMLYPKNVAKDKDKSNTKTLAQSQLEGGDENESDIEVTISGDI